MKGSRRTSAPSKPVMLLACVVVCLLCSGGPSQCSLHVDAVITVEHPLPPENDEETSTDESPALSARRVIPPSLTLPEKRHSKVASQSRLVVFDTSSEPTCRSKKRRNAFLARVVDYLPIVAFVAVCIGLKLWYSRHREPSVLRDHVDSVALRVEEAIDRHHGRVRGIAGPGGASTEPVAGSEPGGDPPPSPTGVALPSYEEALQDVPPAYDRGGWGS